MTATVELLMIRALLFCSGPGADGPGRGHVAADAQEVLVLIVLSERLV